MTHQHAHCSPARLACATLLALAALLPGCGGGGTTGYSPHPGCTGADAVSLAGAGNVLSITVTNTDVLQRRFTVHGQVRFSGQANGASGGYSTMVLTDGQSPVAVGTIQAQAGAMAQGMLPVSATLYLAAGQSATWHLAHAPLPAPYGWSTMRFTSVELCAE